MKRKATRKPRKSHAQRPARRSSRRAAKAAEPPAADPLDPMITASARALGLKIEPAWQPEIRAHLAVILRHGARAAEFALPDEAEPAPVFKA